MKMSYRLLTIVSMFLLGFTMAACELEETCDPNIDPNCVVDTGRDVTADTGTDTPAFQSYFYVLVEDRDTAPSGDTPGADVQAVELGKGGGSFYISAVADAAFGSSPPEVGTDNANFNNVIGAPEGGCDLSDSDTYDTFVSLGGEGGYFIGSFGSMEEIVAGNSITVHTCIGDDSEFWDAFVGVATDPGASSWVQVINDGRGTITGTVPVLPEIPIN